MLCLGDVVGDAVEGQCLVNAQRHGAAQRRHDTATMLEATKAVSSHTFRHCEASVFLPRIGASLFLFLLLNSLFPDGILWMYP